MFTGSVSLLAIAFVFGAAIGSFLNVCIHRIPLGESVARPRSRCPECRRPIPAWHNIPVLSYFFLRGRCSSCGRPISWRYPAVEMVTGLLAAGLFLRFGMTPSLLVNALFVFLLIVLLFIDLDKRILPDSLTLGGMVIGLVLSPWQHQEFLNLRIIRSSGYPLLEFIMNPLISSVAGILFGAGFLWGVAWLYLKIRKKEGMGFGDVKMIAMIGAFTGWQLTWLTILLGSLLGAVAGGGYMYLKSRDSRYELPFGTFLGIAAIVAVFYGPGIISWYFSKL